MFDFTALGELLIDFTEGRPTEDGRRTFEQNAGGAPANAACVVAAHQNSTAFIGKVGCDLHGDFLIRTLEEHNVDTSGLVRDPNVFTTLAFVALEKNGERKFSFARKPGADTCLTMQELMPPSLRTRVLHVGSLSLTDEPARGATLEAIRIAKKNGALLSFDPNYRAPLWPNERTAADQMRSLLPQADLLKLSLEEAPLLCGESTPQKVLDALAKKGVKLIALTDGANGSFVRLYEKTCFIPAFSVQAVDTTGAGDIFWGAFLSRLLKSAHSLSSLTPDSAADFARYASGAAALSVQRRGGIPSIPRPEEIVSFLEKQ